MFIRVLGAAAGGGFPQWNCNHPNSRLARAKNPNAKPRTQSSLAVSLDKKKWFIFNASPDLRQQLWQNPELMPVKSDPLRYSPIMGVFLTNADVDHTAGLINLRESQAFNLYATQRVIDVINKNSIFNVLNPKFVKKIPVKLDTYLELLNSDSSKSGIKVKAFAVPGKVALWLEDVNKGPNFGSVEEDTIALEVYNQEISKTVSSMFNLANESDIDGVVCSPHELKLARDLLQDKIKITPGIRLSDSNSDDQSRVMNPKEAIDLGATYLVIGRPITSHKDKASAFEKIYQSIYEK